MKRGDIQGRSGSPEGGDQQGSVLQTAQLQQVNMLAAGYADSDVSSPGSVGGGGGGGRLGGSEELGAGGGIRWEESGHARVKLMCSYGGRILPRPHDNQLRYVGGESRIVVVARSVSFAELMAKLSRLFGASVLVKYQLPCEDLDALISVTSDEDLDNMMDEYDRLLRSGSSARLRLFLFPARLERSQTSSLSEMLADGSHGSRERWFVDAINGNLAAPPPSLPRVRSETSSVMSDHTPDYLFGLDEWAAATSYSASSSSAAAAPAPAIDGSGPDIMQPLDSSQSQLEAQTASLFGSLLQPPTAAGDNQTSSVPASPLKRKPMGSSSSAPPAVISMLSAMAATAATKGMPPQPPAHVAVEIDSQLLEALEPHSSGSERSGSIGSAEKKVDPDRANDQQSFIGGRAGNVKKEEVSSEHLLPKDLILDEDLVQKPLSKADSFQQRSDGNSPAATVAATLDLPVFDEPEGPAMAPLNGINHQVDRQVAGVQRISDNVGPLPISRSSLGEDNINVTKQRDHPAVGPAASKSNVDTKFVPVTTNIAAKPDSEIVSSSLQYSTNVTAPFIVSQQQVPIPRPAEQSRLITRQVSSQVMNPAAKESTTVVSTTVVAEEQPAQKPGLMQPRLYYQMQQASLEEAAYATQSPHTILNSPTPAIITTAAAASPYNINTTRGNPAVNVAQVQAATRQLAPTPATTVQAAAAVQKPQLPRVKTTSSTSGSEQVTARGAAHSNLLQRQVSDPVGHLAKTSSPTAAGVPSRFRGPPSTTTTTAITSTATATTAGTGAPAIAMITAPTTAVHGASRPVYGLKAAGAGIRPPPSTLIMQQQLADPDIPVISANIIRQPPAPTQVSSVNPFVDDFRPHPLNIHPVTTSSDDIRPQGGGRQV